MGVHRTVTTVDYTYLVLLQKWSFGKAQSVRFCAWQEVYTEQHQLVHAALLTPPECFQVHGRPATAAGYEDTTPLACSTVTAFTAFTRRISPINAEIQQQEQVFTPTMQGLGWPLLQKLCINKRKSVFVCVWYYMHHLQCDSEYKVVRCAHSKYMTHVRLKCDTGHTSLLCGIELLCLSVTTVLTQGQIWLDSLETRLCACFFQLCCSAGRSRLSIYSLCSLEKTERILAYCLGVWTAINVSKLNWPSPGKTVFSQVKSFAEDGQQQ